MSISIVHVSVVYVYNIAYRVCMSIIFIILTMYTLYTHCIQDGDHVVAGARGMMRYRRNRASTMEGQQSAGGSAGGNLLPQQQLPTHGMGYGVGAGVGTGGGNAPWAMYQTNGKPTAQAGQLQVSLLSGYGCYCYYFILSIYIYIYIYYSV